MNITKIVGGLCGALLVYLLVNWVGETLYHVGGGGHGDDHAKTGYVIEVAEAAQAGDAEEVVAVPFADLLAAADVAKGAKVFGKCKSCHKLEVGGKATGPHLFGIFDRAVGAVAGFGYSSGMANLGGTWNADQLNAFLIKPKDLVPGTKMSFAGLKKETDRANLIAYLQTVK
jgi:cytochrome c